MSALIHPVTVEPRTLYQPPDRLVCASNWKTVPCAAVAMTLADFDGPARTLSPIGDRMVCGPLTAATGRVVVVVGLGAVVVGALVVGRTVVGVALFPVRLQPPAARARVVSPTAVKKGQERLFVLPACLSLGRTSILRMLAQASSGSVALAV